MSNQTTSQWIRDQWDMYSQEDKQRSWYALRHHYTLGHVMPAKGATISFEDFSISPSLASRTEGMYVLGKTGMGKSSLILGLIQQDIRAGRGVCLIDPHGDLVSEVLDYIGTDIVGIEYPLTPDDVFLLDLHARDVAFGLNLFACTDPSDLDQVAQTAERVVGIFKRLWGDAIGPRSQDLLENAVYALVALPGTTLVDLPKLIGNDSFRQMVISALPTGIVRDFWEFEFDGLSSAMRSQVAAPLLNKVRAFLRHPLLYDIVSQPTNTVDWPEVIDQNKIVLISLDSGMPEATNLIGAVLLLQLLEAALQRRNLERDERHPFMLYVDEFHRFASDTFVTMIREVRKFGICTTAATQFHNALPSTVQTAMTGMGTIVCYQLVPEDMRDLASLFPEHEETVLIHDVFEYLLKRSTEHTYLYTLARTVDDALKDDERQRRRNQRELMQVDKRNWSDYETVCWNWIKQVFNKEWVDYDVSDYCRRLRQQVNDYLNARHMGQEATQLLKDLYVALYAGKEKGRVYLLPQDLYPDVPVQLMMTETGEMVKRFKFEFDVVPGINELCEADFAPIKHAVYHALTPLAVALARTPITRPVARPQKRALLLELAPFNGLVRYYDGTRVRVQQFFNQRPWLDESPTWRPQPDGSPRRPTLSPPPRRPMNEDGPPDDFFDGPPPFIAPA